MTGLMPRILGVTNSVPQWVLNRAGYAVENMYPNVPHPNVQSIRKMKKLISGKTLFEDFVEKIEWNQEAVTVQNPYSPAQIVSIAYAKKRKMWAIAIRLPKWS